MDTGERLAAYLAGDLDTDEVRRLEADLARDPSLRERLERTRRLEDALDSLPPVEVPSAFSERLRATVQHELDRRPVHTDELAARRERRRWGGLPTWLPAAAGAAAVMVAVVAVGVSLSGVGGGDDSADEGAMTTMETEAADGAGGEAFRAIDGPVVLDEGRAYDADAVQALAGDERIREIVGQGLSDEAAAETADRYAAALGGAGTPDGDAAEDEEEPAEAEEQAGDSALAPPPTASLEYRGDVSEADRAAVGACLEQLMPGEGGAPIPVYAELATFEGEDAIVYGAVAHDPDTGAFTRVELWVVARDGCEVLFFAQDDGG